MAKAERRERSTALYETILKLRDLEECRRFFEDLCTPTELQAMEQRFDVAVYLQQGLVYLDILEKTGASSATISRVRRSCWKTAPAAWCRASLSGRAWTSRSRRRNDPDPGYGIKFCILQESREKE